MRSEHQTSLEHFRNDFGRACLEQAIELAVVERAYDHRQLRAHLLDVMKNLQRCSGIGEGYCDGARLCQARRQQCRPARRIAIGDTVVVGCRLVHAFRIRIEGDERDLLGLKKPR